MHHKKRPACTGLVLKHKTRRARGCGVCYTACKWFSLAGELFLFHDGVTFYSSEAENIELGVLREHISRVAGGH